MIGDHTYEEIRDVVIDILTGRVTVPHPPVQWQSLLGAIGHVLFQRARQTPGFQAQAVTSLSLTAKDAELARDVFWDLFRQGVITLGSNDANPNWPHFRLSHFGDRILNSSSPWRFHDSSSYIAMVRQAVPDIKDAAVSYLEEASAAFYSGCLLASCVMLGVAAEAEFLRLVQAVIATPTHATVFKAVDKEATVLRKIVKFRNLLKPLIPQLGQRAREGLEANFDAIQFVLRVARNDAGHPTSAPPPSREQVFVYLQLFVPFARQLRDLREDLGRAPD